MILSLPSQDKNGETVLMYVLRYPHTHKITPIETVNVLLEAGADPNLQSLWGHTALMLASKFSYKICSLDIVKVLLKAGSDVNLQHVDGITALMYASYFFSRFCTSIPITVPISGKPVPRSNLFSRFCTLETVKVLIDTHYKDALKDKDMEKFNKHVASIEEDEMNVPTWNYIRNKQKQLRREIHHARERMQFIIDQNNTHIYTYL